MCSRFTLSACPKLVRDLFAVQTRNERDFPPRYNIAPTQPVLIVRRGHHRKRELALVRWGLVPDWVKNPDEFTTLVNARSETAQHKPSFRAAMKYRRCLFPANGFYEWSGSKSYRQPWFIHKKGAAPTDPPLALAGLWEHWLGSDGSEFESAAILTTTPNKDVCAIHNRMPVIIPAEAFGQWLDCDGTKASEAADMLRPAPDHLLIAQKVKTDVNNPLNDAPELIMPEQGLLF